MENTHTTGASQPMKTHTEVASHSVEHAKEKTEPLSGGAGHGSKPDAEEGNMNNGETGVAMETENR